MSGASISCCRICGEPLTVWSSRSEWGVEEATDDCERGCKLHHYQFSYGATREQNGIFEETWSHDERTENYVIRKMTILRHEDSAKELWQNWTKVESFVNLILEHSLGDLGPRGPFADFLEENDICPLTVKLLREEIARESH
jgi:hypothetical protein